MPQGFLLLRATQKEMGNHLELRCISIHVVQNQDQKLAYDIYMGSRVISALATKKV